MEYCIVPLILYYPGNIFVMCVFNVLLQRHAIEFVSTLITLGLFSPILFLMLLEFLPDMKKNPAERTPKWTMYFDYTHLDLRIIRT